jgi:hypothetical protein
MGNTVSGRCNQIGSKKDARTRRPAPLTKNGDGKIVDTIDVATLNGGRRPRGWFGSGRRRGLRSPTIRRGQSDGQQGRSANGASAPCAAAPSRSVRGDREPF